MQGRNIVLQGEIGCGKTTLLRKALGMDISKAGGFITARIKEQEELYGFVLAPVKMLGWDRICMDDARQNHLPCFLSFSDVLPQETAAFSKYAAEYLRQAVLAPFAVIDEIGGVELLEDAFYEELIAFLQSDIPWVCVWKTEKAAAALCRRISMGSLYWERYQKTEELLKADQKIQRLYMTGFEDQGTEQILRTWARMQDCQYSAHFCDPQEAG